MADGKFSVSVMVDADIREEMERRKFEDGQPYGWQVNQALRFWFENGGQR